MDNMEGFVSDDELSVEPLARLGWQVRFVSWRQRAVSWDAFDLVVIRTTWDYQNALDEYLGVLDRINQATRLENDIRLVRWNIHKSYLQELERRGIPIVPTMWGQNLDRSRLEYCFQSLNCQELVIKPTIGANADHTYRLARAAAGSQAAALVESYGRKPFMAQPFMPAILTEGEYSLFFFAGDYSHAILKSPRRDDFRVQEEHGGLIQAVQPEPLLRQRAKTAVAALDCCPLYARVDMVRDEHNDFAVMELELIEPSLYLRMDAAAPERFAAALTAWVAT